MGTADYCLIVVALFFGMVAFLINQEERRKRERRKAVLPPPNGIERRVNRDRRDKSLVGTVRWAFQALGSKWKGRL